MKLLHVANIKTMLKSDLHFSIVGIGGANAFNENSC